MRKLATLVIALFVCASLFAQNPKNAMGTFPGEEKMNYATDIITGAQRVKEYIPILKGKKVCVLSNQSGMVTPTTHVLDTLLSKKINVTCIMSPEHGFRGDADAGEHVSSSVDAKTGNVITADYDMKWTINFDKMSVVLP